MKKLFVIILLLSFSLPVIYFFKVYSSHSFTPKVSIITSVYDGDEFIEGFLKDITEQTIFDQCELIMINANSPGNEEKIIRDYLKKYPNIIYVKLDKDPGLYAVWNQAVKMSSANLISNANLDDRSDPNALEILAHELEAFSDIDLVYTGYLLTHIPNETFLNHHAVGTCDPPEFSKKNMMYCLPGPRPMWRKSMHERFGFFDETFTASGDADMWLRAVSKGARFKKIPRVTTLYYFNPKGLSTNKDEKKILQRTLEGQRNTQTYFHLIQD